MATEKTAQVKFDPTEHLIDLKGKKYLEVGWRIFWFRSEHPSWSVTTEVKELTEAYCRAEASAYDDQGRLIANAFGHESKAKSPIYYMECAETHALGRLMAHLGYGSQYEDLDLGLEDPLLVDAPADAPVTPKPARKAAAKPAAARPAEADVKPDAPATETPSPAAPAPKEVPEHCADCGAEITDAENEGKMFKAGSIIKSATAKYSKPLCMACYLKAGAAEETKKQALAAAAAPVQEAKASPADDIQRADALNTVLSFGKHKGKTIASVIAEGDKKTLQWYATDDGFKESRPEISAACRIALGLAA